MASRFRTTSCVILWPSPVSGVAGLFSAAEKTRAEMMEVALQTLEGHLRAILGTLTVEEINADRQAFAQKMTDEAAVSAAA